MPPASARTRLAAEAAARLGERIGQPLGAGAPQRPAQGLGSDADDSAGAEGGRRRPKLGVRWRIEPSAALLVAVVAAGLCGWWGWSALRPDPVAIPAAVEQPGVPWPGTTTSAPPSPADGAGHPGSPALEGPGGEADVVVDVQGQVARPGVHRLPPGSRVVDALAAAGGPVAGGAAPGLNLARLLVDGEQIVVGAELSAAGPGAPPAAVSGPSAAGGKVDLNRAGLTELDALPGVGPVLAQRILDFRAKAGRFRTVEELREVSGIGERTYARLAPLVRV